MANLVGGQSFYSDGDTEANCDVVDLSVVMNIELFLFVFLKRLAEIIISVYELLLLLFKCCVICLFLRFRKRWNPEGG